MHKLDIDNISLILNIKDEDVRNQLLLLMATKINEIIDRLEDTDDNQT